MTMTTLEAKEELRRSIKSFIDGHIKQSNVYFHTGIVVSYTVEDELIIRITDIALSTIELSWKEGHLIVLDGEVYAAGDSVVLAPLEGRFIIIGKIATDLISQKAKGIATILDTTVFIVVNHTLSVTPTLDDFTIIPGEEPTNSPGLVWIETITSTQFTIK